MQNTFLITGSRVFSTPQQDTATQILYEKRARNAVEAALKKYVNPNFTKLLCGGARGVDYWAIKWALGNETTITVVPARWSVHGQGAGLTRNENMLIDYRPGVVLAFWNGRSNGTKHMFEFASRRGTRTMVFTLDLDWLSEQREEPFPEPETNY